MAPASLGTASRLQEYLLCQDAVPGARPRLPRTASDPGTPHSLQIPLMDGSTRGREWQRKHLLGPGAAAAQPGSAALAGAENLEEPSATAMGNKGTLETAGSGAMLEGFLTVPPFIRFSWPQVSTHVLNELLLYAAATTTLVGSCTVNESKKIKSNLCQIRLWINILHSLSSHLLQIWNLSLPVQDSYYLQVLVNERHDGSASSPANTARKGLGPRVAAREPCTAPASPSAWRSPVPGTGMAAGTGPARPAGLAQLCSQGCQWGAEPLGAAGTRWSTEELRLNSTPKPVTQPTGQNCILKSPEAGGIDTHPPPAAPRLSVPRRLQSFPQRGREGPSPCAAGPEAEQRPAATRPVPQNPAGSGTVAWVKVFN